MPGDGDSMVSIRAEIDAGRTGVAWAGAGGSWPDSDPDDEAAETGPSCGPNKAFNVLEPRRTGHRGRASVGRKNRLPDVTSVATTGLLSEPILDLDRDLVPRQHRTDTGGRAGEHHRPAERPTADVLDDLPGQRNW